MNNAINEIKNTLEATNSRITEEYPEGKGTGQMPTKPNKRDREST